MHRAKLIKHVKQSPLITRAETCMTVSFIIFTRICWGGGEHWLCFISLYVLVYRFFLSLFLGMSLFTYFYFTQWWLVLSMEETRPGPS